MITLGSGTANFLLIAPFKMNFMKKIYCYNPAGLIVKFIEANHEMIQNFLH